MPHRLIYSLLLLFLTGFLVSTSGCAVSSFGQPSGFQTASFQPAQLPPAQHRCGPNCPGHPTPRPAQVAARTRPIPQQKVPIAQVAYRAPRASSQTTPLTTPQAATLTSSQTAALTEPKRLSPSVRVNSSASPELHKPWNMDEFRPRIPNTAASNPYRLVADVQTPTAGSTASNRSVNNRSVPPPMDLSCLTATLAAAQASSPTVKRTPSQVITRPAVTAGRQRMPILELGRDFVKEFRATNDRTWSQNHAVLQTASLEGNLATIHNVRYSKYDNTKDGGQVTSTRYYDATFNLEDIRTIDLVIVPFKGAPRLAHVQSSFGFADGRHIGLSIEARYEEGEKYDPLGSVMRQFELIYVFADERDLIREGAVLNNSDVHVYRLKFEPSEVREMFVDALTRANKLAEKPEFYHPLRNSCVTNLMAHINKGRPKAIPKEYRTLLPGLMDNYAYDLKLIDTSAPTFKEAKENSKVNWLAEKYGDLEYFSAGIRQNMY